MIYTHDSGFSVKKAGGIGLTVALHVLVACGVLYGLQHSFIRYVPPIIDVTPIPEPLHKEKPVERAPQEPTKQQVIIHDLPLPLIEIKTDMPPVVTTIDKPGPGIDIFGKHAQGGENPGEGGTGTAHAHVSSPVITNLDSCKPEYPRASLLKEETGTVRVRFEIGADSKLVAASVVHSSGHPLLDRAAVNALSQCQFKAAQQDGAPVGSSLVTDYVWRLGDE